MDPWTEKYNDILQRLWRNTVPVVTNSGIGPWDIALTKTGYLLYANITNKTVNIVKKEESTPNYQMTGMCSLSICICSTSI